MARLFPVNRLKETAAQISTSSVQAKIDVVKEWHSDYHHGSLRKDKETSREQQYNQDFFIKVLGYREKPASPYTLEPKASSVAGQLPDLILGSLSTDTASRYVNAVVELKGASIDLDRPQGRAGKLSPVQQAFKYRPLYRDCAFVIVSNFYEFRLYNDNQLDFESWTLDDLVNPANDYQAFKTWYVLLNADHLTAAGGPSWTENLLSKIRIQQMDIGKIFYSEYRQARIDLIVDILENNPAALATPELAVEKAQKLIDRVVFACFAEDKGLLPDDAIHDFVRSADNSYSSFWDNLKGFFTAIDKGSAKLGIPTGYNGGLFAPDDTLDGLTISESILRRLTSMAQYNFTEDLGVNILGHIFEQSITDLEEIRSEVQGVAGPIASLKNSKRKSDGVFYTPDFVVRYIVDQTLGEFLRKAEERCLAEARVKADLQQQTYAKREAEAYRAYQHALQHVRIVDPACGSGAFLVHVFDFLMAENKRVGSVLGDLFSTSDYVRHVLRTNIHGVDKNEESVEITKLSLWLKSATKNEKLTSLDDNIKHGNSLIEDPLIDPDQAFSWNSTFSEVLAAGGFDVVVGNPPYVDSETMTIHAPEERVHIAKNYRTAKGNWDLYIPFTEKALSLVRQGGYFGFIMPNKVLSVPYGLTLRKWIDDNYHLREIVDISQQKVFEQADVYPVILLAAKESSLPTITITTSLLPLESRSVARDVTSFENWSSYLSVNADNIGRLKLYDAMASHVDFHSAATVSEAYDLIPHIVSNPAPEDNYLKIVNTGTIDPFSSAWAFEPMQYIKEKYTKPCVLKAKAPKKPWLGKPRIIIAGMALAIEALPDPDEEYLAAKSTVVATFSSEDELFYAQGLLSSGVLSEFFKEEFSAEAMAGGYLNFTAAKLGKLPYIEYDPLEVAHKDISNLSRRLTKDVALRDEYVASAKRFLEKSYGFKSPRGHAKDFLHLPFDVILSRLKGSLSIKDKVELEKYIHDSSAKLTFLDSAVDTGFAQLNLLVSALFSL
ncbi:Eco57I restriction-modification methylase domain-containing protein [Arthrobacter sp. Soil763]|uniref:Eco57I restriction-modification methylase domain-containing protein n=1 Tax=Arthrobacter sp. Soil763 TaxID=1736402 RepID=UPI00138F1657|nr:N-6 DNA methylase [Arthrobacter sp. Soil763]